MFQGIKQLSNILPVSGFHIALQMQFGPCIEVNNPFFVAIAENDASLLNGWLSVCKKAENTLNPLNCFFIIRRRYLICVMAGYQFMYGVAVHMMKKNTGCTVCFIHMPVTASNQYDRPFFLFEDGLFSSESG